MQRKSTALLLSNKTHNEITGAERESKADTLKATEANRKRGPGTREKVSRR
jgi:hypothetical protein